MLQKYQDILIEQFSKVNSNGKTIHGDIHPGNIFIDVQKLKEGRSDFFTLIDTGNTIEQSSEQALRFMNLTAYIKNGDYENIARFVLDGATLPKDMSSEKAYEIISTALKTMFFDDKTGLGIVNNDTILEITDGIMKKHNIIPSDTQGNLMKAKKSANNSYMELQKLYITKKGDAIDSKGGSVTEEAAELIKFAKEEAELELTRRSKTSAQEKRNLRRMPLNKRAGLKKGKNAPKENSEDYLTYRLKQFKLADLIKQFMNFGDKMNNLG